MAIIKSTNNKNAGENVRKRVPSYTIGGNVRWCSHYRNQYGGYQKTKNRAVIWSCVYKSAHNRNSCMPMFIAGLFIVVKLWNQHRCPSTNEWIKKMWYIIHVIHSTYTVIQTNEIMPFAGKRIEMEIMLSEISQVQKDKCWNFFSYVESGPKKTEKIT
jgi:hypothetical protein